MTLSDKLTEREITSVSLSEILGLSRPSLRKYLNKPYEFKVKHVRKIAKYLKISERTAIVNYFKKSESYE